MVLGNFTDGTSMWVNFKLVLVGHFYIGGDTIGFYGLVQPSRPLSSLLFIISMTVGNKGVVFFIHYHV